MLELPVTARTTLQALDDAVAGGCCRAPSMRALGCTGARDDVGASGGSWFSAGSGVD